MNKCMYEYICMCYVCMYVCTVILCVYLQTRNLHMKCTYKCMIAVMFHPAACHDYMKRSLCIARSLSYLSVPLSLRVNVVSLSLSSLCLTISSRMCGLSLSLSHRFARACVRVPPCPAELASPSWCERAASRIQLGDRLILGAVRVWLIAASWMRTRRANS